MGHSLRPSVSLLQRPTSAAATAAAAAAVGAEMETASSLGTKAKLLAISRSTPVAFHQSGGGSGTVTDDSVAVNVYKSERGSGISRAAMATTASPFSGGASEDGMFPVSQALSWILEINAAEEMRARVGSLEVSSSFAVIGGGGAGAGAVGAVPGSPYNACPPKSFSDRDES